MMLKYCGSSFLFQNNGIRAVRFHKAVDFPEQVDQVYVLKQGSARLVVPEDDCWSSFFSGVVPPGDLFASLVESRSSGSVE
jgi:virulence-associated protein VagC